jgi:hypothetical protein
MKPKYVTVTVATLILTVITYCIGAFVAADPMINHWTTDGRVALAIIWGFAVFPLVGAILLP